MYVLHVYIDTLQEVSFGFFESGDLDSLTSEEQQKLHMILQRNKPATEEDLQASLTWASD